ncbi:hypothetical protein CK203_113047 [Vitis vinifera]|uniref:Uncharacterized protein n=1 Tax=Vitis vinifera TaxID=29760 RepID=A0A438BLA9_VITVI|nr:hypothetical protein CK203_113047 [Vitis vinifera]
MFTTEKQGYEEGVNWCSQEEEEARTDRLSVRLQGGRTGNDREGESGGEAGEDSQSLIDGVWKMGSSSAWSYLWKMGLSPLYWT